jgi:hypothetical protein
VVPVHLKVKAPLSMFSPEAMRKIVAEAVGQSPELYLDTGEPMSYLPTEGTISGKGWAWVSFADLLEWSRAR